MKDKLIKKIQSELQDLDKQIIKLHNRLPTINSIYEASEVITEYDRLQNLIKGAEALKSSMMKTLDILQNDIN